MNDTTVAVTEQPRLFDKPAAGARENANGQQWLLLFHQLPPHPAYFRVKIWRRLQTLGAVGIKNSVYVLPMSEQTQEDFQWLLREITAGGGEGSVCQAQFVDGLTDAQVREMFNVARNADYDVLLKDARGIAETIASRSGFDPQSLVDVQNQLTKLRKRFSEISALDFFAAASRKPIERLLASLERQLHEPASPQAPMSGSSASPLNALSGRTWVTRQGVYVDRMASAWLIRRFVDPAATFKFVDEKSYTPVPGELRFDMFEGEFTHEGDLCTFEVLIVRAGLATDRALEPIAQIVHDIDLKDNKFAREEAAGITLLLNGIMTAAVNDEERLARAGAVFDDLYEFFKQNPDEKTT